MVGKYPNDLQRLMKQAGMGPTELARRAGTSKQNVDRHAKGERELTVIWARRYAPHLSVSVEELAVGPQRKAKPGKAKTTVVPLLSKVPAGKLWTADGVDKRNVRKTLAVSGLPQSGDWIALEVEGDSMDKIAHDGAIIFIDRNDQKLVRDRFYVFQTESGDSTFKRFRPGPPDRLVPFSTSWAACDAFKRTFNAGERLFIQPDGFVIRIV